MNVKIKTRQKLRKAAIIFSLLIFPITLNYFSPYLIIDSASQGVINGSFILFGIMFVLSLFLGRLWCAWVCPAAGLQEIAFEVTNKPVKIKRLDWIKWLIWGIWIVMIFLMALSAGGYKSVDFFYLTDHGISVSGPMNYIIYYTVLLVFFGLAVFVGRRAGCHSICWMSPFMIIGRKIRNFFKWPALRLTARTENCINCKKCTQNCPMSLDVNGMVQVSKMEHTECILCGSCVDVCPKDVIHYAFSSGTEG